MTDTNTLNTGRVKWFNNKAGYGFITWSPSSGDTEEDIFVHHSALSTEQDQFRYLVEGEYVTFSITEADNKIIVTNVTGPDGGKLMCETRRNRRQQNESRRAASAADDSSDTPSKDRKQSSFRGGGPRSNESKERILVQMADQDDGTVWELVRHGGNNRKRRSNNRRPRKTTPSDTMPSDTMPSETA